jgi:hypothetical protein
MLTLSLGSLRECVGQFMLKKTESFPKSKCRRPPDASSMCLSRYRLLTGWVNSQK